ncbi:hypothetical protein K438DRAFT_1997887 [Mycena galopus ATCC 62051]|nr:hypothetical protein K438DRAFT_1997887 [Mycena galopus ATCC 62051]
MPNNLIGQHPHFQRPESHSLPHVSFPVNSPIIPLTNTDQLLNSGRVVEDTTLPAPQLTGDISISPPQPMQAESISSSSSSPHVPSSSFPKAKGSRSNIAVDWDPWPDGDFEVSFTWAEYHATGELPVHWACESVGGDKRGSDAADEWLNGGVHYLNGGMHDHLRPTHILHLSSRERDKFTKIVQDHPNVGPLALLVGRPGLHGPEKSVADISSVLFNRDRIKSERRAIKRQGNLADSEFAQFAQFERENPGFIIFSQFESHHLRDAINVIVSDGAHGYFIEHNALLLTSSAYCLPLDCWVPGVLSYANGATQEHFFLHFLAMFESMASYAEKEGQKIKDSAFKNVVDFSDAERLGFIEAFVQFWQRRKDDYRTEKELRQAASALLKGCQQHYRAQVNRVKKISAVVSPGLQDAFANEAMALIDADDYDDFMDRVERLVKRFPKVDGWIRWWSREPHAKMLFKPFREMPVDEWDSMPNTTNAEESQHFEIYSALRKKHALIPGLKALRQLAHHYHLLENAASSGMMIRYGKAEDWKNGLKRRSRQKQTVRSNRRDGRPPDTAKALAGPGRKSRSRVKPSERPSPPPAPTVTVLRPSYAWNRNSCYLDTSLELIFHTVTLDFERQFASRSTELHNGESVKRLFELMSMRREAENRASGGVNPEVLKELDSRRDNFRKFLHQTRIVPNVYAFNPLFAWLESILTHQHDTAHHFARSYFQTQFIHLWTCSGDEQTPNHFQLKHLTAGFGFNLTATLCRTYRGDVEKWFRDSMSINRSPATSHTCWRNVDDDGVATCSGAATFLKLILGIPVMLVLELPTEWDGEQAIQWNFPQSLRPLTAGAATMHGVVYEIVGRAFSDGSHFKAMFTPDGKNVYSYDDMDPEHRGCAVLQKGTNLAGTIPSKSGWRTYSVVYSLQGGTRAQSFFSNSQIATAWRVHSIVFASSSTSSITHEIPDVLGLDLPDVAELPAEQRFWLRYALRRDTIDFVSSQTSLDSAKRRVRFVNEDGDGEDDLSDSPRPAKKRRPMRVLSDDESGSDSVKPALSPQAKQDVSDNRTELRIHCRWGKRGEDPDIVPARLVKCVDIACDAYAHVSCQRNGKASTPAGRKSFRCDTCRPPSEVLGLSMAEFVAVPQKRKRQKPDNPTKTPLSKRLLAGKGALARYGKYWYPVRLIFKDGDSWEVSTEDLCDELWANSHARRQIQLGKWIHAFDTVTDEDSVFEFRGAPYTDEIEDALRPHIEILGDLLNDPEGDHPTIPAAVFARAQKKVKHGKCSEMMRNGGIPFTGELPDVDCARVANWIYHCVPDAKGTVTNWIGRPPLAHAYTILIAYRNHHEILQEIEAKSKYKEMDRQAAIFAIAWRYQRRPTFRFCDIDHECLNIFKERLFEQSRVAGRAGNQQWGLDIGTHQDNWNPYAGLPADWNHGDRDDESDSELQPGPNYRGPTTQADANEQQQTRPRRSAKVPRRIPTTLKELH